MHEHVPVVHQVTGSLIDFEVNMSYVLKQLEYSGISDIEGKLDGAERQLLSRKDFWGTAKHPERVIRAVNVRNGNFLVVAPVAYRIPKLLFWYYFCFNGVIYKLRVRGYDEARIDLYERKPAACDWEQFKSELAEALFVYSVDGHAFVNTPPITPNFGHCSVRTEG